MFGRSQILETVPLFTRQSCSLAQQPLVLFDFVKYKVDHPISADGSDRTIFMSEQP